MDRYLAVLLGGAIGSLARYLVGMALISKFGSGLPLATFVVNITGSFAIGYASALQGKSDVWRLTVMTGFLGGFTTFSALELEIFSAWKAERTSVALLYPVVSIVLGVAAVWAGALLAKPNT